MELVKKRGKKGWFCRISGKYLKDESYKDALIIQSGIIGLSRQFLHNEGFVEYLPVIVSTITDPLNRDVLKHR